MIQSLENFVSMAIQDTQIPMYTKHTLFLYFSDFSIFFFIFIWKTKQSKKKINNNNKNMLNNQNIKTRLTQNLKAKHISNAHTKTRREREKWQNHLEPFSFHTLEEPFLWLNPWTDSEGEKPFKFERNMRALRRSPRGAREDWSWFWFPDAIMPLLCWVASHL